MEFTPRQQKVLDIITDAAREGRVCPTNKAIAKMDGLSSASSVADAIRRLQRKGIIKVKRFNRARVVRLPDLDLQTAIPSSLGRAGRAPHWRNRKPGVDYSNKKVSRRCLLPPPAAWRRKWPYLRWSPTRCQYFTGSPGYDDARKCGMPVIKGSPYCAFHHALCYTIVTLDEDT